MKLKSYDVVGNIAILKFPEGVSKSEKVKVAKELLEERKSVKTVVEKSDRVKGRLRKIKTVYLAGEKTRIAEYVENGCVFRFDVDETYFSPRLSNERKEVALKIKKRDSVLVMFAGVGPFPIVIAKLSKAGEVVSNELNRKATKFARENVILNKLKNVEVVQGDSRKVALDFAKKRKKFDKVVMPRPNLKDNFLDSAFQVVKKGGIIFYYGFSKGREEVVSVIKEEARRAGRGIRVLGVKKAGEIAPYKFRWRVDFKVL
ncbi:hypothetical protein CMI46_02555 [Candidatus Pacearchaeota archaeon]|nr:hypothetical protein [Candidatus Pacearchaeota archaeon]|tara:strand:+ start:924 stop:1700 length:777 start_codon:yes stop_codon:yes gene_type:complete